eukprot:194681-Rhodomonas_salina.1
MILRLCSYATHMLLRIRYYACATTHARGAVWYCARLWYCMMPGTELACYAMGYPVLSYAMVLSCTRVLRCHRTGTEVHYGATGLDGFSAGSALPYAQRCPGLTHLYQGSDLNRTLVLILGTFVPGIGSTRTGSPQSSPLSLRPAGTPAMLLRYALRPCYAMPGTDLP